MNNVYVRNKTSIKSISLYHMLALIPVIIYGLYKNGIYLYMNKYIGLSMLFRPIIILFSGFCIGAIVNIIYEKLIKRNKDTLLEIIFSSFHAEYGLILGCLCMPNTNVLIFIPTVFVCLFISKFLNNRINTIAFSFIVFFLISKFVSSVDYNNIYESSKIFHLTFMDYMIGKNAGGLATTHIILILVGLVFLALTNNIKKNIAISSLSTYIVLIIIYCIVKNESILESIFITNYIFAFIFVATDTVSSSYSNKGTVIFGILIGVLTFGITFLYKPLAPFIAILIASIFNNLIDRKASLLK